MFYPASARFALPNEVREIHSRLKSLTTMAVPAFYIRPVCNVLANGNARIHQVIRHESNKQDAACALATFIALAFAGSSRRSVPVLHLTRI
jgi:hypothetical protein